MTPPRESDTHMTRDTAQGGGESHDDTGKRGHGRWQSVVSELRKELDPYGPSAGLIRRLRPGLPQLVEDIVNQIQRDVPAYAGPMTGARRRLLLTAVSAATTCFIDSIEGKPDNGRRVDDLFRRMGYGEARDGHDLGSMRAALRIATRDTWDRLRSFASEHEISADLLGQLGDALFGYFDHLNEQVTFGFDGARHALDREVGPARLRLLDSLLEGAAPTQIQENAETAVWSLPTSFVVMSAAFRGPFPSATELESNLLLRAGASPALIVCDSADTAEVTEELQRHMPSIRIAVSWPVPIAMIADAHRWTRRALQLVDSGAIPPSPVINCADHIIQLWLQSEPALRRRQCQELLQPLFAETPNMREILSETMLAWLETRDSAATIGARLGVHQQTVRYRWKRINELFDEDLQNPEFVLQVTMLLKASIPLWKAGDQSDFDNSWTSEAT